MFRNGEGRVRGVDLVVAIVDKLQYLCLKLEQSALLRF